jgi:hypothetical protein
MQIDAPATDPEAPPEPEAPDFLLALQGELRLAREELIESADRVDALSALVLAARGLKRERGGGPITPDDVFNDPTLDELEKAHRRALGRRILRTGGAS